MDVHARRARTLRIGGISGIVGTSLALAMVFAATALSSQFSWNVNALSDLGISDVAALFNSAVIIGGLLTIPFAFGLRAYLPRNRWATVGSGIFIAGGISLALVGILTEDYPLAHTIVSLGYFVLVPLGILLLAAVLRGPWRIASIVAGLAALLVIVPTALDIIQLPGGFAIPEMIEALLLAAWVVAMGVTLVLASRQLAPEARVQPAPGGPPA